MSIASQLQAYQNGLTDAYNMVSQKGGTMPVHKNMSSLASSIATIPSGGGRWAYDIHTERSGANPVKFARYYGDTPPTIDTPFLPTDITEIDNGALIYAYNSLPYSSNIRTGINLNSITTIRPGGMYYAFSTHQVPGFTAFPGQIKDIGFSNLTTVYSYGLSHAFEYQRIENYSFPSLTTVQAGAFENAFSESRTPAPGANVSFPVLTSVEMQSFKSAFSNPANQGGVLTASFPSLVHVDKTEAFYSVFTGNYLLQSVDFGALETVGQNESGKNNAGYAFHYAFYNCSSLATADFSSLKSIYSTVNGYCFAYAFMGCASLQTIDFSSLTSTYGQAIFQSAFSGCSSLTSADFRSLTTCSNYGSVFYSAFKNCSSLTTVNFDLLTDVGASCFYEAFQGCTSLSSINFKALSTISSSTVFTTAFKNCTALTTVSFPALTSSSFGSYNNQFNNMLTGCSNVTVHFPAAVQSTIGNWSSVTSGFGGTNTTVLFDL